ncbi:glycosyltransferase family 2 protein [Demequina muriae]|uniref:Cellulose synthase catalytic subunit n=1 Tax=Demequina muriae TaxID=3051664 RepID=A0ABT8GH69_9MICO|nr:cellulose synthase catalytic subunit [Demequina sp. EGI L300058]MDN4480782.1 cellulose synthase catalytic subunit [Demequina sp. EGI L300058]
MAADPETATPPHTSIGDGRGPSPVMILLVLVSTLGILVYTGFLLDPSNRGDLIPYIMVITAESILVFHALLAMWTILSGAQSSRDFAYHRARAAVFGRAHGKAPEAWPLRLDGRRVEVDVFITVYGEDLDVVRRTATAALAMHGRHRTWILDDGRSDDVRDLAGEIGARYVRRLSSGGAKAGNVNHALTLAKSEFFAIFDADFVPHPTFLAETIPFMVDEKVAFVQTPQAYGNLHTTVARGAAYMQAVFYRFIQPGRNRFNAAFCVGTNVLFRRAAIDDVHGICTDSKSEDVWTSLALHERGWRSVFIPEVLAVGEAPDTIEAYSKQQLRWATGGFEILLTRMPLANRRLTMDQRIQYFVTATFYLTGICPLLLILVPPLEIYFDLRPMNLSLTVLTWAVYYCGFYAMQIVLAWYTLGSFRWETLTLATVSFPIYAKAFINAFTGRDVGWQSTGTARGRSPYNFIIPQILFFLFLLLTSGVAIWRDIDNGVLTLATAWNITNTVILGAFVGAARREARALRTGRRGSPRRAPGAPGPDSAPRTVVARPAGVDDTPKRGQQEADALATLAAPSRRERREKELVR